MGLLLLLSGGPTQQVYPVSDVSNPGGWTDQSGGSTDLYNVVDEDPPNLSDYIQSPNAPSASAIRLRLGTITTPGYGSRMLRWTVGKDPSTGAALNATLRLYQGVNLLQTFTRNNIPAGPITYSERITAAISDYTTPLDVDIEVTQA